jgi:hypothetical protein
LFPAFTAIFFETELQKTIFVRPKIKVFGFRQKKGRIFGKDQLFSRQRIFGVGKEPNIRLFGYSVRPVVGRSLFVTPQVFQFIGPSKDGRRHGRGTYLFFIKQIVIISKFLSVRHPWKYTRVWRYCLLEDEHTVCERDYCKQI